jgi:hypothetical protein
MSTLKIFGGTAKGGKNLCDTCAYGINVKGYGQTEKINACTAIGYMGTAFIMPFAVCECSYFVVRGTPYKKDMEEIALKIDGTHIKHEGFAGGKK